MMPSTSASVMDGGRRTSSPRSRMASSARLMARTASSRCSWILAACCRSIVFAPRSAHACASCSGINILIRLAQYVLLHLAHGVARQIVDDEDALRHLEFGQLPIESPEDGRFADLGARMAHHHRGDALAEI